MTGGPFADYRTCNYCGAFLTRRAMWESEFYPGVWQCRSARACVARAARRDRSAAAR